MDERVVTAYCVNDDPLPLHPDFYEFVQQDENGLFVQDKNGNRWGVTLRSTNGDSKAP